MKIFYKVVNFVFLKYFPTMDKGNLRINGILHRRGRGIVSIGSNVTINSSTNSNILGGSTFTTLYVKRGKRLTIGDNVGISNATIVALEQIDIGNNVLIGADVKIYDTDFHSLDYRKRGIPDEDIPNCKPIVIKDHAFIGAHSIVLKGVTIGERSIVGAGSVVTKSIPNDEIWGGNPAKFIRKVD